MHRRADEHLSPSKTREKDSIAEAPIYRKGFGGGKKKLELNGKKVKRKSQMVRNKYDDCHPNLWGREKRIISTQCRKKMHGSKKTNLTLCKGVESGRKQVGQRQV